MVLLSNTSVNLLNFKLKESQIPELTEDDMPVV